MKNTNCPLVKSHQKSQLSGQKNKTAGGFGIAILTGLVAIAFSGGWILAAGVSTQSKDADRLHAQPRRPPESGHVWPGQNRPTDLI